ncbi:hypothetical protein KDL01_27705 [Actinospica durhamensis]|uniref:Uncharacterized protein n=1 Tax=Actinospica durhamensis TaxID=1508375 RepID=A0A941EZJ4_9ACTN|nr:hypothetical protein [Actinospica durhamensis]MBR7837094.1 hypothetical protein [Actinospica durhamensis]
MSHENPSDPSSQEPAPLIAGEGVAQGADAGAAPQPPADAWALPGSPALGGPVPGQPPVGAYGPGPYGYGPYGYGVPGGVVGEDPAARAAKARRRQQLISLGAVLVVVAGIGICLLARGSSSTGEPALPQRAGDLVLETDAASKAEAANVLRGAEATSQTSGGLAGAYGPADDGHYTMVFLELPYSTISSSAAAQFQSVTPSELVSETVSSAGMESPVVEMSADASAALSCGTMQINSIIIPTCVWAGENGMAIAYYYPKYQITPITEAAAQTDVVSIVALK